MSYPAGVVTRNVIVGPFLDLSGDIIPGQVQVEIPFSLKWAADGTLILPTPETIFLDSNTGQGQITLPIIQSGFVTGPSDAIVGTFAYRFTPILNAQSAQPVNVLELELGYGDGSPFEPDFNAPVSNNGAILYVPSSGVKGDPGAPGAPGPSNSLSIGTVVGLAPGATPTASITGGAPSQTLNLGIPQGAPGVNGSGQGLPVGGTANQVLTKTDSTDYHVSWQNNSAQGIPAGGTINQLLAKVDGTDYNTHWVPVPLALPTGGTTGQYLKKNSNSDGDAGWITLPVDHDLPTGGTTGQVLSKIDNTDRNVQWSTPSANGLPAGGVAGQFLKKNSITDGDASFASFGIADMVSGAIIVNAKLGTTWPSRPTNRADIRVAWVGPYVDDAHEPAIITVAGTGGMLDGVDFRWRTQ